MFLRVLVSLLTIAAERDERPMKVLVADDDPGILNIYGEMLEWSGCKVTVARDGVEAFDRFQASDYDLVLMDLHMPNMDGFQCIAKMQKRRKTPTIIITGHYPGHVVADRIRAMDLDIGETLLKPVTATALFGAIKRMLSDNPAAYADLRERRLRLVESIAHAFHG